MSSNVHYQFKSSKEFSTITFEGSYISLGELKKAITAQKKLGKGTDFDLQITNAQTGEEYKDDAFLVPKNTSVIVCRMPAATGRATNFAPSKSLPFVAPARQTQLSDTSKYVAEGTGEVTGDSGLSDESEKIKELVSGAGGWLQPTANKYSRYPNRPGEQPRIPPPTYVCHRCNLPGHYINHCPTNGDSRYDFHKVKKPTGIPRSFLKPVDAGNAKATLMMPGGGFAVMQPNEAPFQKIATRVNKPGLVLDSKDQDIPPELQCTMCKRLMKDAVLIPCCGYSFCDDCIRQYLLDNELICPMCKEGNNSPDQLLPNRKLREAVDSYKRTLSIHPSTTQGLPPSPSPSQVEASSTISPSPDPSSSSQPSTLVDAPPTANIVQGGEEQREIIPVPPPASLPVQSVQQSRPQEQAPTQPQGQASESLGPTRAPAQESPEHTEASSSIKTDDESSRSPPLPTPGPSVIPSQGMSIPVPVQGPIPVFGIPPPHFNPHRGPERRPAARYPYDEVPFGSGFHPGDMPFFPQKNERLCFKCGSPGHLARNCPTGYLGHPYEYGVGPGFDPRLSVYPRYPPFVDSVEVPHDPYAGPLPHRYPPRRSRSRSRGRSTSRSRDRTPVTIRSGSKTRSNSRSPRKDRTRRSRSKSRSPQRKRGRGKSKSRSPIRSRSPPHTPTGKRSREPQRSPSPSRRKARGESSSPPRKRSTSERDVKKAPEEVKRDLKRKREHSPTGEQENPIDRSNEMTENSKRQRSHTTHVHDAKQNQSSKRKDERKEKRTDVAERKAEKTEKTKSAPKEKIDRGIEKTEDKTAKAGSKTNSMENNARKGASKAGVKDEHESRDAEAVKGREARVAAIAKNRGEEVLRDIPPLMNPRKERKKASDGDSKHGAMVSERSSSKTQASQSRAERKDDRRDERRTSSEDKTKSGERHRNEENTQRSSSRSSKPGSKGTTETEKGRPIASREKDNPPATNITKGPLSTKGNKDAQAVAVVRDLLPKGSDKANSITNSLKEGPRSSSSPKERSADSSKPSAPRQDSLLRSSAGRNKDRSNTRSSSSSSGKPEKQRAAKKDSTSNAPAQVVKSASEKAEDKTPRRENKVVANFRLSVEQAARSVQQGSQNIVRRESEHNANEVGLRTRTKDTARRTEKGSNTQFLVTL